MKKYTSAWFIIAQTNLHAGDENSLNFGVIDQTVQRDAISDFPCINSSSLKGAVKEFITQEALKDCKEEEQRTIVKNIFGSHKKDSQNTQKGNTIFFDASLLALPRQCTSQNKVYELTCCEEVLNIFTELSETLGIKCSSINIKENLTNQPTSIDMNTWKILCDNEHLPIIARNCLDNGESTNLWYEQVIPSQAVFGTIICSDDENLEKLLDGKIIQIGANATIGFGYCKFVKLNLQANGQK